MLCKSEDKTKQTKVTKRDSNSLKNTVTSIFKENNQTISLDISSLELDIFHLQQILHSLKTEEEAKKLSFYLNEDFISKFKQTLQKITSETNIIKQIQISIKDIDQINNTLINFIDNISSECKFLKMQVNELSLELEQLNSDTSELSKLQNNNFILNQKLISLDCQVSNIDHKIKEYKKNKWSIEVDLLYRDPNNLNKVLDSELNIIRENTTRLTKTINYYKTKTIETKKVIAQMENELQHVQEPKTLLIIPKNSDYSTNEKVDISSTSMINYDPAKTKLNELIKKYNIDIININQECQEYKFLNEKFEKDNELKKKELAFKLDQICKLEIELEMLK